MMDNSFCAGDQKRTKAESNNVTPINILVQSANGLASVNSNPTPMPGRQSR